MPGKILDFKAALKQRRIRKNFDDRLNASRGRLFENAGRRSERNIIDHFVECCISEDIYHFECDIDAWVHVRRDRLCQAMKFRKGRLVCNVGDNPYRAQYILSGGEYYEFRISNLSLMNEAMDVLMNILEH